MNRGWQVLRVGMLLMTALLGACSGGTQSHPSGALPDSVIAGRIASAHLRRHLSSSPATLDPALVQDVMGLSVDSDLFEGLLRQGADGALLPGMAERWEVSADALSWKFHLRAAQWSNGDPVTAGDFVFAWRRVVDPATASPVAQQMAPVAGALDIAAGRLPPESLGATAIDARTLEVHLESPTPFFLSLLINSFMMPVHPATVQREGRAWTQPGKLVGNGAFLLQSREVNGRIDLIRNPRYWDAAAVRLAALTWFPLTDSAASTARFLAGDLDETERFQVEDLDWLRASLGDQVRTAPYNGTVMLGMNVRRPPFDDARLRRAMVLALDRPLLTDQLLKGLYEPAYGIVPPLPGYVPPRPEWADLDTDARHELARRLYAEAGYSRAKPLEVELSVPLGSPEMRRVFEALTAMWRMNLGAEVRVITEEFRVHQQNRRIGKLPFFWNAWIGDYPEPTTYLALALNSNPQNYMRFDDPQYERLMAEAMRQTGEAERHRLYREAESLLDREAPFLPIYFYKSRHLLRSYVQGWQDNANDLHPSRDLYLAPKPER
ncbi:MAG: peptide ABC transporter substrate-binding protein [Steroidobacteraceae bacterium]